MQHAIHRIPAFVSHLSGDISHLIGALRLYEIRLTATTPSSLTAEDWERKISESIAQAEKMQLLLDICVSFLMKPDLLSQAELEVDTSGSPIKAWDNLIAFYRAYQDRL